MSGPFTIVGLGEAVFDVFPDKEVLGGTSLNVAVQAHQLQAPLGGRGVLLSRIGRDDLGKRLQEEFSSRNLPLEFLQIDPVKPTGQVRVSMFEGAPSYEIVMDTACDHEEIGTVASLLDLPSGDSRTCAELMRVTYDLDAVVFTRGKLGTFACTSEGWVEGEPAGFPLAENADSVGAGDACTAALLSARLLGRPWNATLDMANRHGAFVASQPGATPYLSDELWESYKLASQ